jgi:hypothetical protein
MLKNRDCCCMLLTQCDCSSLHQVALPVCGYHVTVLLNVHLDYLLILIGSEFPVECLVWLAVLRPNVAENPVVIQLWH